MMFSYQAGTRLWGYLLAVALAGGAIFVVDTFGDHPEDAGTVLATIIVTLGGIWSWFLQTEQKERHHRERLELDEIRASAKDHE